MNHSYKDFIKPFLSEQFAKTAKELKLTQEQIAELLQIDTRSYAYLQAGVYMCSTTTLLLYLTRVCPDTESFLSDAKKIFEEADEHALLYT